jgi:hypothetical protein
MQLKLQNSTLFETDLDEHQLDDREGSPHVSPYGLSLTRASNLFKDKPFGHSDYNQSGTKKTPKFQLTKSSSSRTLISSTDSKGRREPVPQPRTHAFKVKTTANKL